MTAHDDGIIGIHLCVKVLNRTCLKHCMESLNHGKPYPVFFPFINQAH